jgi:hypothetical protein
MTEAERRLKAQLDSNTAAIARMQRQAQVRQPDPYEEAPALYEGPGDDGYGGIDQDQLIMQAITQKATADAVKAVNSQSCPNCRFQKTREDPYGAPCC